MYLGEQKPRLETSLDFTFTSAPDIVEMMAGYGMRLDPWQEHFLGPALAEQDSGRWVAQRVGLSVPRQNGKTAILEAREMAGLLLFGEQLIIHSAHEVKTALEAFQRIKGYFENYDDLRGRVRRIVHARGSEEIALKTGQRLRFMARSTGAGRGFSADCVVLDEGQILSEATFAAILPTLSARPNPQVWITGTPPNENQDGTVFEKVRESGLQPNPSGVYYAEWSADPELSLDDPKAVQQSNPALGIRIQPDFVQGERESMSDDHFARERTGQWDVEKGHSVIPMDTWALLGTDSPLEDTEISIAVDVNPTRSRCAVAIAGLRRDFDPSTRKMRERTHVEVIQYRDGVGWAVDYIAEVVARRNPRAVVVDNAGPAGALIEPLRARGVLVTTTNATQVGQACGQFYDAAMEDRLRHFSQPQLNSALGAARKRNLGDAWAWHRKDATDISPLVAVTLAYWGLHAEGIAVAKTAKTKQISNTVYTFN